MSWYETGFGGMSREEDRLSASQEPYRFFIKPGVSGEVIMIDDEPFCIHEHTVKMNGKWNNHFTCLKGVDDPVCCTTLGENTRGYIGFTTIVSCTKTIDKKGNTYQYEVQLFGAKLKTLKKLRRKKDEKGSLVDCRYKATREDDKSPNVGDEFEFVDMVKDPDKLFAVANYRGKKLSDLWDKADVSPENLARLKAIFQVAVDPTTGKVIRRVAPFNYAERLKPKSAKDLGALFRASTIDLDSKFDDKKPAAGGVADHDVPF